MEGRGDGGGSQREFLERLIVVIIAGDAKKGGRGKVGGNARPTFSLLIREEEKGIQKRKERLFRCTDRGE